MTRTEATAWRERWRLVNEAEIHELRSTPLDRKMEQLAAMMEAGDLFPISSMEIAENERVRATWIRVRKVLGARGIAG